MDTGIKGVVQEVVRQMTDKQVSKIFYCKGFMLNKYRSFLIDTLTGTHFTILDENNIYFMSKSP